MGPWSARKPFIYCQLVRSAARNVVPPLVECARGCSEGDGRRCHDCAELGPVPPVSQLSPEPFPSRRSEVLDPRVLFVLFGEPLASAFASGPPDDFRCDAKPNLRRFLSIRRSALKLHLPRRPVSDRLVFLWKYRQESGEKEGVLDLAWIPEVR